MTPDRIWITGAHGFIGRHLARALAQAGHQIAGIGHGAWPANAAAQWGVAHWLNGAINASNLHALGALTGLPHAVMHLAGGSSVGAAIAQPREDFGRTVASTVELLEWLRQESSQTVLVAVSSAAVYGSAHPGPIAEEASTDPYSPYGHHKLMMESLCRSYGASFGIASVVARLFSVYGAGLRKQLLWDLCTRLTAASTVVALGGSGGELRDWTEVHDVVEVLAALPQYASSAVPTFNVGSGIATSVREVAEHVLTAWQADEALRPTLRFSGESRQGDPFSLVADPSKLHGHGLACKTPATKGLADYVNWFRADGTPAP
jgi:UDP-glucose 4-epimerase